MSKFTGRAFGIETLVKASFHAIEDGAYVLASSRSHDILSLRKGILSAPHAALITEIKFASPSLGKLPQHSSSPEKIASSMVGSGATALSVLTQPNFFDGSIKSIERVRRRVPIPIMMKDIIVSKVQIEAGKQAGADCVLLIKSVFDKNLAEEDLGSLYEFARGKGLEIMVETHSDSEYEEALGEGYSLVGINNRDLESLKVDITTTKRLIAKFGKGRSTVITESGIASRNDIKTLHKAGADAFLVGTSIMEAKNVALKVRELYESI